MVGIQAASSAVPAVLQGLSGMVGLPGGTFQMGSTQLPNAQPLREVKLSPFAIGAYEVTNEDWQVYQAAVQGLPRWELYAKYASGDTEIIDRGDDEAALMAAHAACVDGQTILGLEVLEGKRSIAVPSPEGFAGDRQPVVCVTWKEARAYCAWYAERVSKQTGRRLIGRLPTEAEWEYAARAGHKGDDVSGVKDGKLKEQQGTPSDWNAHWSESVPLEATAPVGSYAPNDFGLYDMAGNVWEWVMDRYASRYNSRDVRNPRGPEQGVARVRRGGSWYLNEARHLLTAFRTYDRPVGRSNDTGFRVVLVPRPYSLT